MSQNPYQKIYDDLNITITPQTTLAQAQILARHLGYLYNTFGIIVKDLVSLLGERFKHEHAFLSEKNKKDKKLAQLQARTEKKSRSQDQMEDQQLEGKFHPPPPIARINQIQNYNQPGNLSARLSHTHSQTKNAITNHSKTQPINEGTTIQNKDKLLSPPQIPNNNPFFKNLNQSNIEQKRVEHQQKTTQNINKQKDSNANETNSNNKKSQKDSKQSNNNSQQSNEKKIIKRKGRDYDVINISSDDEQKDEDSATGVKTRAQQRGEQKPIMRPDSLLRKGKGRGRPRGRTSSRSSSRVDENTDEKQLSSYPLHSSDPFTIVYNVPYRASSRSGNDGESEQKQSKKDQKMEKRLKKQLSQSSSQQESPGPNQHQSKAAHQENNPSSYTTPYKDPSFIKKVMTSYLQEKQQIKGRLQSMDKEYEQQNMALKLRKNMKTVLGKEKPQNEDDGYEYEVEEEEEEEEEMSYEEVHEDVNCGQVQEQRIVEEQREEQDQGQEEEEEMLPFQKLNPSPKPSPKPSPMRSPIHSRAQQSQYYLNQIDQSIRQQFEQNLRMNQSENDSNEYEEQISYESPANEFVEEEDEYGSVEGDSVGREEVCEEQINQIQDGQVMDENRKPAEEPIQCEQADKNGDLFDRLFRHEPINEPNTHPYELQANDNALNSHATPQYTNSEPQRKPSNAQLPHPNDHPVATEMEEHLIYNSSPLRPQQINSRKSFQGSNKPNQKPILSADLYFPFAHDIPNPQSKETPIEKDFSHQGNQPRQNNMSDKEELLKVLDAFESDEEQPKKDVQKPVVSQELRQVIINRFTMMKNQLTSGQQTSAKNLTIPPTDKFPPATNPLQTNNLQLQNSSIHQNKQFTFSLDNKHGQSVEQKIAPSQKLTPSSQIKEPIKGGEQKATQGKKANASEFVSFAKKTKYIEVIDLE